MALLTSPVCIPPSTSIHTCIPCFWRVSLYTALYVHPHMYSLFLEGILVYRPLRPSTHVFPVSGGYPCIPPSTSIHTCIPCFWRVSLYTTLYVHPHMYSMFLEGILVYHPLRPSTHVFHVSGGYPCIPPSTSIHTCIPCFWRVSLYTTLYVHPHMYSMFLEGILVYLPLRPSTHVFHVSGGYPCIPPSTSIHTCIPCFWRVSLYTTLYVHPHMYSLFLEGILVYLPLRPSTHVFHVSGGYPCIPPSTSIHTCIPCFWRVSLYTALYVHPHMYSLFLEGILVYRPLRPSTHVFPVSGGYPCIPPSTSIHTCIPCFWRVSLYTTLYIHPHMYSLFLESILVYLPLRPSTHVFHVSGGYPCIPPSTSIHTCIPCFWRVSLYTTLYVHPHMYSMFLESILVYHPLRPSTHVFHVSGGYPCIPPSTSIHTCIPCFWRVSLYTTLYVHPHMYSLFLEGILVYHPLRPSTHVFPVSGGYPCIPPSTSIHTCIPCFWRVSLYTSLYVHPHMYSLFLEGILVYHPLRPSTHVFHVSGGYPCIPPSTSIHTCIPCFWRVSLYTSLYVHPHMYSMFLEGILVYLPLHPSTHVFPVSGGYPCIPPSTSIHTCIPCFWRVSLYTALYVHPHMYSMFLEGILVYRPLRPSTHVFHVSGGYPCIPPSTSIHTCIPCFWRVSLYTTLYVHPHMYSLFLEGILVYLPLRPSTHVFHVSGGYPCIPPSTSIHTCIPCFWRVSLYTTLYVHPHMYSLFLEGILVYHPLHPSTHVFHVSGGYPCIPPSTSIHTCIPCFWRVSLYTTLYIHPHMYSMFLEGILVYLPLRPSTHVFHVSGGYPCIPPSTSIHTCIPCFWRVSLYTTLYIHPHMYSMFLEGILVYLPLHPSTHVFHVSGGYPCIPPSTSIHTCIPCFWRVSLYTSLYVHPHMYSMFLEGILVYHPLHPSTHVFHVSGGYPCIPPSTSIHTCIPCFWRVSLYTTLYVHPHMYSLFLEGILVYLPLRPSTHVFPVSGGYPCIPPSTYIHTCIPCFWRVSLYTTLYVHPHMYSLFLEGILVYLPLRPSTHVFPVSGGYPCIPPSTSIHTCIPCFWRVSLYTTLYIHPHMYSMFLEGILVYLPLRPSTHVFPVSGGYPCIPPSTSIHTCIPCFWRVSLYTTLYVHPHMYSMFLESILVYHTLRPSTHVFPVSGGYPCIPPSTSIHTCIPCFWRVSLYTTLYIHPHMYSLFLEGILVYLPLRPSTHVFHVSGEYPCIPPSTSIHTCIPCFWRVSLYTSLYVHPHMYSLFLEGILVYLPLRPSTHVFPVSGGYPCIPPSTSIHTCIPCFWRVSLYTTLYVHPHMYSLFLEGILVYHPLRPSTHVFPVSGGYPCIPPSTSIHTCIPCFWRVSLYTTLYVHPHMYSLFLEGILVYLPLRPSTHVFHVSGGYPCIPPSTSIHTCIPCFWRVSLYTTLYIHPHMYSMFLEGILVYHPLRPSTHVFHVSGEYPCIPPSTSIHTCIPCFWRVSLYTTLYVHPHMYSMFLEGILVYHPLRPSTHVFPVSGGYPCIPLLYVHPHMYSLFLESILVYHTLRPSTHVFHVSGGYPCIPPSTSIHTCIPCFWRVSLYTSLYVHPHMYSLFLESILVYLPLRPSTHVFHVSGGYPCIPPSTSIHTCIPCFWRVSLYTALYVHPHMYSLFLEGILVYLPLRPSTHVFHVSGGYPCIPPSTSIHTCIPCFWRVSLYTTLYVHPHMYSLFLEGILVYLPLRPSTHVFHVSGGYPCIPPSTSIHTCIPCFWRVSLYTSLYVHPHMYSLFLESILVYHPLRPSTHVFHVSGGYPCIPPSTSIHTCIPCFWRVSLYTTLYIHPHMYSLFLEGILVYRPLHPSTHVFPVSGGYPCIPPSTSIHTCIPCFWRVSLYTTLYVHPHMYSLFLEGILVYLPLRPSTHVFHVSGGYPCIPPSTSIHTCIPCFWRVSLYTALYVHPHMYSLFLEGILVYHPLRPSTHVFHVSGGYPCIPPSTSIHTCIPCFWRVSLYTTLYVHPHMYSLFLESILVYHPLRPSTHVFHVSGGYPCIPPSTSIHTCIPCFWRVSLYTTLYIHPHMYSLFLEGILVYHPLRPSTHVFPVSGGYPCIPPSTSIHTCIPCFWRVSLYTTLYVHPHMYSMFLEGILVYHPLRPSTHVFHVSGGYPCIPPSTSIHTCIPCFWRVSLYTTLYVHPHMYSMFLEGILVYHPLRPSTHVFPVSGGYPCIPPSTSIHTCIPCFWRVSLYTTLYVHPHMYSLFLEGILVYRPLRPSTHVFPVSGGYPCIPPSTSIHTCIPCFWRVSLYTTLYVHPHMYSLFLEGILVYLPLHPSTHVFPVSGGYPCIPPSTSIHTCIPCFWRVSLYTSLYIHPHMYSLFLEGILVYHPLHPSTHVFHVSGGYPCIPPSTSIHTCIPCFWRVSLYTTLYVHPHMYSLFLEGILVYHPLRPSTHVFPVSGGYPCIPPSTSIHTCIPCFWRVSLYTTLYVHPHMYSMFLEGILVYHPLRPSTHVFHVSGGYPCIPPSTSIHTCIPCFWRVSLYTSLYVHPHMYSMFLEGILVYHPLRPSTHVFPVSGGYPCIPPSTSIHTCIPCFWRVSLYTTLYVHPHMYSLFLEGILVYHPLRPSTHVFPVSGGYPCIPPSTSIHTCIPCFWRVSLYTTLYVHPHMYSMFLEGILVYHPLRPSTHVFHVSGGYPCIPPSTSIHTCIPCFWRVSLYTTLYVHPHMYSLFLESILVYHPLRPSTHVFHVSGGYPCIPPSTSIHTCIPCFWRVSLYTTLYVHPHMYSLFLESILVYHPLRPSTHVFHVSGGYPCIPPSTSIHTCIPCFWRVSLYTTLYVHPHMYSMFLEGILVYLPLRPSTHVFPVSGGYPCIPPSTSIHTCIPCFWRVSLYTSLYVHPHMYSLFLEGILVYHPLRPSTHVFPVSGGYPCIPPSTSIHTCIPCFWRVSLYTTLYVHPHMYSLFLEGILVYHPLRPSTHVFPVSGGYPCIPPSTSIHTCIPCFWRVSLYTTLYVHPHMYSLFLEGILVYHPLRPSTHVFHVSGGYPCIPPSTSIHTCIPCFWRVSLYTTLYVHPHMYSLFLESILVYHPLRPSTHVFHVSGGYPCIPPSTSIHTCIPCFWRVSLYTALYVHPHMYSMFLEGILVYHPLRPSTHVFHVSGGYPCIPPSTSIHTCIPCFWRVSLYTTLYVHPHMYSLFLEGILVYRPLRPSTHVFHVSGGYPCIPPSTSIHTCIPCFWRVSLYTTLYVHPHMYSMFLEGILVYHPLRPSTHVFPVSGGYPCIPPSTSIHTCIPCFWRVSLYTALYVHPHMYSMFLEGILVYRPLRPSTHVFPVSGGYPCIPPSTSIHTCIPCFWRVSLYTALYVHPHMYSMFLEGILVYRPLRPSTHVFHVSGGYPCIPPSTSIHTCIPCFWRVSLYTTLYVHPHMYSMFLEGILVYHPLRPSTHVFHVSGGYPCIPPSTSIHTCIPCFWRVSLYTTLYVHPHMYSMFLEGILVYHPLRPSTHVFHVSGGYPCIPPSTSIHTCIPCFWRVSLYTTLYIHPHMYSMFLEGILQLQGGFLVSPVVRYHHMFSSHHVSVFTWLYNDVSYGNISILVFGVTYV